MTANDLYVCSLGDASSDPRLKLLIRFLSVDVTGIVQLAACRVYQALFVLWTRMSISIAGLRNTIAMQTRSVRPFKHLHAQDAS